MSDEQHIQWLRRKLQGYKAEAERYNALVASTTALLREEDSSSQELLREKAAENRTIPAHESCPDTVNASLPGRKPQYEKLTLRDALVQIFSGNNSVLNAGDLSREVYVIETEDQLRTAKRSISSELSRGVRQDLWLKVGRDAFTAQKKEEETPRADNLSEELVSEQLQQPVMEAREVKENDTAIP